MKFGVLKTGKKDNAGPPSKADKLAELEGQLNNRTHNLKQTEAKLKKLSGEDALLEVETPVVPHGPAKELTLDEAPPAEETAAAPLPLANAAPQVIEADGIKLKEFRVNADAPHVSPPSITPSARTFVTSSVASNGAIKAAAPPPPAPKPEEKKEAPKSGDLNNLGALFAQDDEEENPLASLIKSLPDVPANELVEDVKEIKDIIKDWQKK